MNPLSRGLMSGEVNTNRPVLSYALTGVIDFICLLMAAEAFREGKYRPAIIWAIVGVVALLIGYYWPQMAKWRGRRTKIEFTPSIDPFVQWNTPETILYRVAVQSEGDHSGVSLVVSKIDPHPGQAVTEIPLMQRHDRRVLNEDGNWKKMFDLHRGQPVYIDVLTKHRDIALIGVMHVMEGHVDQLIPAGNYTMTLETRGAVLAKRQFAVTVDSEGNLGFRPL